MVFALDLDLDLLWTVKSRTESGDSPPMHRHNSTWSVSNFSSLGCARHGSFDDLCHNGRACRHIRLRLQTDTPSAIPHHTQPADSHSQLSSCLVRSSSASVSQYSNHEAGKVVRYINHCISYELAMSALPHHSASPVHICEPKEEESSFPVHSQQWHLHYTHP